MKRKVLVPIFNRAHYGRLRPVLLAIKNHPALELQIITAVPAAYTNFWGNIKNSRPHSWMLSWPWYVRARVIGFLGTDKILKNDFLSSQLLSDGFNINGFVPMFIDGGVSDTMAKSVGLGIPLIVEEIKRLKPDIVFVNADRFEMMAVALAASYMNVPIVHNEGGDVSGTIDESIRHSITKLAHIHFTSTESSRKRVIQMGENPERVFAVGSPAIDAISNLNLSMTQNVFPGLDTSNPFLLALLHPVATASAEENSAMAANLICALKEIKIPTVLLGSNTDAGSDEVGKAVRNWIASEKPDYVFFTKHLHPDDFYGYLSASACAVGNSSSFIREGAYFGIPVVLIGSRQNRRERDKNILKVDANSENIKSAIFAQMRIGRFPRSNKFGDGTSSFKIADKLATVDLDIQKIFCDL